MMPTKHTDALVAEVLARLSGGEPLAQICRDDKMPSTQQWREWASQDETLAIAYARAREDGFDAIAIDALRIADDGTRDDKLIGDGDSERLVADSEWISRSKLRVETRLKLLAKWDPKRYGDKLDVTTGGESLNDRASALAGARKRAGADG